MSSVGQALGGVVGGVIGFMVGGPVGALRGAQIGIMAGGLIDPPDGPVINGPRLDDLSVQTSTYGAFIPRNYGTIAQNGNIFWLKGDALTETPRAEESGGKGGPTTTTNLWDYSATFALGLCEGPIDGIRRIWINGQLFYDAGSDDLATIIAGSEKSDLFTLYTGTDTQDPDPLMQADKGAANVPAYRGLAYIVFENLPLANYNNSLASAQIKVEIVKIGTISPLRQLASTVVDNYPMAYYPRPTLQGNETPVIGVSDGVLQFYCHNQGTYSSVDGFLIPDTEGVVSISMEGDFIGLDNPPGNVMRPQIASSGELTIQVGVLGGVPVYWNEKGNAFAIGAGYNLIPYGTLTNAGTSAVVGSMGDISAILPGEAGRSVSGLACAPDGTSMIIVTNADKYYIVDPYLNITRSGPISTSPSYTWGIGNVSTAGYNTNVYFDNSAEFGWIARSPTGLDFSVLKFTIDDDDVLRLGSTITVSKSTTTHLCIAYYAGVFYVLHHNSALSECELFRFTDVPTITSGTTTLGDIVEAECLASSLLEAADIDVTELTDTVRGYRIASLGALRGGLDPLRAAYPFDVVQHGYQIKFKRRGSASVATITADELDARAAGDAPGVQITNSREMDTLLPSSLRLNYLDAVREYDTNEQISDRGL